MTVDDDFVGQNGDFMLIKLNTGLSPYQSKFNFFIDFLESSWDSESRTVNSFRC